MANNPAPNELGFAEFISKLISEMFDAITTSQFDQEKRLAELAQATVFSVEEFGERYITDEQVYTELVSLFPGDSAKYPTSVYTGAPYHPKKKSVDESPAIEQVTGVMLDKNDYGKKGESIVLKQSAIVKVSIAVRNQLARFELVAIKQILNRGVPRVVADAGKIRAKLTYEVLSTQEAAEPERIKRLVTPLRGVGSFTSFQKPSALSSFNLLVRQADERAPQTPNLKVDVFGEVEITFKTIT